MRIIVFIVLQWFLCCTVVIGRSATEAKLYFLFGERSRCRNVKFPPVWQKKRVWLFHWEFFFQLTSEYLSDLVPGHKWYRKLPLMWRLNYQLAMYITNTNAKRANNAILLIHWHLLSSISFLDPSSHSKSSLFSLSSWKCSEY